MKVYVRRYDLSRMIRTFLCYVPSLCLYLCPPLSGAGAAGSAAESPVNDIPDCILCICNARALSILSRCNSLSIESVNQRMFLRCSSSRILSNLLLTGCNFFDGRIRSINMSHNMLSASGVTIPVVVTVHICRSSATSHRPFTSRVPDPGACTVPAKVRLVFKLFNIIHAICLPFFG